MVFGILFAVVALLLPGAGAAQQLVTFTEETGSPSLFTDALRGRPLPGEALERMQTASLFAGQSGLFARPLRKDPVPQRSVSQIARLRDLIASAEAGPMGYDAVQHGARVRPAKPPTAMTVAEVFAWIKATPGQPHAIGRYQFIPATLAYLVEQLEVPAHAPFDPVLQDRLANALLEQAGLPDFLAGRMGHHDFMNAIAKIWAGLPNSSGKSHYAGIAGNQAVLSWAHFEAEMLRIFPTG